MKFIAHIFLALVILFQSMIGTVLVFQYQSQKEFIASTLCENKNKPSKNCEGKCFLKKQFKKAEEAETKLPGTIKEKMELVYVPTPASSFDFYLMIPEIQNETLYRFFIPEVHSGIIVQPPQA